ncbi:MAG: hypothetical protein ACR652_07625 [Methylocystis sp.]|uniref:hypothetical protein n=1 Tax=Methylocystis sp. TaxID=1911079 RepID=UPI003DA2AA00
MSDPIRALATHEAAHAAAAFVLGLPVNDAVLQARDGGARLSGYVGEFHSCRRVSIDDIPQENPGPPPAWAKSFESHRLFLPGALVAWAGPLAQERVAGNTHGDEGDMRRVTSLANLTHYASGRSADAWTRLTRMAARRLLASPMVWRAVKNLADELSRGLRLELIKAEHAEETGLVEFMVPAATAERLLEAGGARRGIFENWGTVE